MWDFVRITYPIARKPHKCAECDGTIAAGDLHHYCTGKVEGDFDAYRLCMACSDLACAWCWKFDDGEGWPMGRLRASLADEGITDLDAFVVEWKTTTAEQQASREAFSAAKALAERAWNDARAERERQVAGEGFDAAHDDEHVHMDLARAAACYLLDCTEAFVSLKQLWPWAASFWKPRVHRANCVRAVALGIAEIQRLDRAEAKL